MTVSVSKQINVSGIQSDSRKVEENHLFVAVRGVSVDGHTYISSAVEKGATVVVCEEIPTLVQNMTRLKGITYIRVKDSAEVLGFLLSNCLIRSFT